MHSVVSYHVFVRPVPSSVRCALFRFLSRARRRSRCTSRRSSAIANVRRGWLMSLNQDGQQILPIPSVVGALRPTTPWRTTRMCTAGGEGLNPRDHLHIVVLLLVSLLDLRPPGHLPWAVSAPRQGGHLAIIESCTSTLYAFLYNAVLRFAHCLCCGGCCWRGRLVLRLSLSIRPHAHCVHLE